MKLRANVRPQWQWAKLKQNLWNNLEKREK